MPRPLTSLFVAAAVLAIVPGWTGDVRLPLLGSRAQVAGVPVLLDPADPARRRVGALTFLDGYALTSPDRAFGGFSAIAVIGRRVTLLSDGGNIVQLTYGRHGIGAPRFGSLPTGPGIGWDKADRDSESLVVDPATGRSWVGFEKYNAIFRFAPGLARLDSAVRPPAMRSWPSAGGPEALVRLPDHRFLAIAEAARPPARAWPRSGGRGQARQGLIWPGDPVAARREPARFAYLAAGANDVADAAALPDGGLLVLERGFSPPYRFHNRLVLVPAGAVRPRAIVKGRELATLDAPLIHDNFEGVAVTRENGATIVWLVSDNNATPLLQRTLLLRFRLDG